MTGFDSDMIRLAELPTPLEEMPRLSKAWGGPNVLFKRDDLSGFGLSGNKVRKLEYHFAQAKKHGADTVITCGAVQSNHCRATALAAARLGFGCKLFLRSDDGQMPKEPVGNHVLQRLAGAEITTINPQQYADERNELMAQAAKESEADGHKCWVIPEGASDRFGTLAFAEAGRELDAQLRERGLDESKVTVWHASCSGATTAGLAIAAGQSETDFSIVANSVGPTHDELVAIVTSLIESADADPLAAPFLATDAYLGGGYGKTTEEELRIQREATQLCGMLWDPTYTGKALVGLYKEIQAGNFTADDTVVFWHTGGGFALFSHPVI